jgi:hypothetical protein
MTRGRRTLTADADDPFTWRPDLRVPHSPAHRDRTTERRASIYRCPHDRIGPPRRFSANESFGDIRSAEDVDFAPPHRGVRTSSAYAKSQVGKALPTPCSRRDGPCRTRHGSGRMQRDALAARHASAPGLRLSSRPAPFTLVVPDRMGDRACGHRTDRSAAARWVWQEVKEVHGAKRCMESCWRA